MTMAHASPEPDAVRQKLHNAIDSLVVQDLARVFSIHGDPTRSMSEQIVDIILPSVTLAAPALSRPAHGGCEDTELLDALRDESWDLRCFDMPTGGGDADIGWRVVGHWMAKPQERTVGEAFKDDPRAAIRDAISRNDRQAGEPRS